MNMRAPSRLVVRKGALWHRIAWAEPGAHMQERTGSRYRFSGLCVRGEIIQKPKWRCDQPMAAGLPSQVGVDGFRTRFLAPGAGLCHWRRLLSGLPRVLQELNLHSHEDLLVLHRRLGETVTGASLGVGDPVVVSFDLDSSPDVGAKQRAVPSGYPDAAAVRTYEAKVLPVPLRVKPELSRDSNFGTPTRAPFLCELGARDGPGCGRRPRLTHEIGRRCLSRDSHSHPQQEQCDESCASLQDKPSLFQYWRRPKPAPKSTSDVMKLRGGCDTHDNPSVRLGPRSSG